jgi:hypothetical protein
MMRKSYTVSGIGVCLGKQPGYEALIESIITGTPLAGVQLEYALT